MPSTRYSVADGQEVYISTLPRTLFDAVYDWARYNSQDWVSSGYPPLFITADQ